MLDGSLTAVPESLIPAEYDHSQRVFCPFPVLDYNPESNTVAVEYSIAVSNDAVVFSEEQTVVAFDSKCMDCTPGFECTRKVMRSVRYGMDIQPN